MTTAIQKDKVYILTLALIKGERLDVLRGYTEAEVAEIVQTIVDGLRRSKNVPQSISVNNKGDIFVVRNSQQSSYVKFTRNGKTGACHSFGQILMPTRKTTEDELRELIRMIDIAYSNQTQQ